MQFIKAGQPLRWIATLTYSHLTTSQRLISSSIFSLSLLLSGDSPRNAP